MQEIAPHVYIETAFPGVTLGAINWPHGLIQIDTPFRPEDIRSWRAELMTMSGGIDRLLINLDAHFDRTLGSRQVECMIVGHEKMAQIFHDRPITFKAQTIETGAEWELYNGIGSIRWAAPEITFSNRLEIYWDANPMILEYHPGPSNGAIWVYLPVEKVIFLGDAVVPNAPPFLANADLPAWKESLALLSQPELRNCTLISGRGGLITYEQVKEQVRFLEKVEHQLEKIDEKTNPDEIERSITHLLKSFEFPPEKMAHYSLRLRWGLQHYVTRHAHPSQETPEE
jgi:glyoxylase-like metal-dependent hydrolase (beta-lactamase superfamily II)